MPTFDTARNDITNSRTLQDNDYGEPEGGGVQDPDQVDGAEQLVLASESFYVALGDKLGRSSGVDWVIQNWAFSARNAPWRGRREEEGREGFSG
jgi:hypothetical protein